jgi:hypothetical protein
LAEEVTISNFGEGGVASEATLRLLVSAFEKMAGTPADAKKAKENLDKFSKKLGTDVTIVEEFGVETAKAAEASSTFAESAKNAASTIGAGLLGAMGGLFASAKNLAATFIDGGDSLTDFAQHVPIVGGAFSILTSYMDNTVATFRDLSSVGAGFNNNLKTIRDTAANLELNLGEMSALIGQNSQSLRLLSGTVTGGITRFAAMNSELKKTGDFESLKNMGFTIEEINEGMLSYTELQANLGRLQKMDNAQIAAGSAQYLEQLNLLSKVTGKSRKELENTMMKQSQDAGFRALMNQFEEGSVEANNFRASMAMIDTLPADVAAGLMDLADGIPQTEEGIAVLTAAGPEIRDAMMAVADGADPQIIIDALSQAGVDMEKFAGLEGAERAAFIANLRASNPTLASILDSATQLTKLGTADFEAAQREQARRDEISSTLTTFDDKVKEIRASIQKAFLDSGIFENAGDLVGTFAEKLTTLLQSDGFKEGLSNFFTAISDFVSNFTNFNFATALFGGVADKDVFDEDGNKTISAGDKINGLFGDLFGEGGPISSAFETLAPKLTTMLSDIAGNVLGGLLDFDIPWGTLFLGGLAGLAAAMLAPVLAIPAGIAVAITAIFGIEAFKDLLSAAWEGLKSFFTWGADVLSALGGGISGLISSAWETVTGWFSFGGTEEAETGGGISGLFGQVWETVKGWFSFGGDIIGSIAGGISGLATGMWNTVTGWFSFGGGGEEGGTSFSITSLMSSAWESVTSFFSLDNFQIPSISSMFQGIIDAVKGFFSFDFEMPNFKAYLPTWLGGEGKSLFGGGNDDVASASPPEPPDVTPAVEGGEAIASAENAIASFAALPDLQNNLDILKNGLDVDGVRSYTLAMEQLVDVLGRLNQTLAEDNTGLFGGGTGVAAADVLGQISTASQGSAQGTQQLNSIMTELLAVMTEVRDFDEQIEKNTKYNTGTNIAAGRISARPV